MAEGPARRATILLGVLGASTVGLVLIGLGLHVPGADSVGSIARVNLFVGVMALAGAAFLAACALVLRHPGGRGTLALVLVVAGLMRVPPLLAPPFLSSDLFRYVWDGRVQLAGINPYRYIPADPALAGLRDHAIFDHVNRRTYARTIYPPTAQVLFRLVASIRQSPRAVKIGAVLCEVLAVSSLAVLLPRAGLPASRILLYAWNPLAAWCYAGNGHVDAAAIGLIGVALLARGLGRDGWSGVALGAAVLVKFLPAAIVPAFWRWRWRLPAAIVATIVLLYIPFFGVGLRHVFGFLGAYGGEEGLRDGQGLWILAGLQRFGPLPAASVPLYAAATVLLLGGLALLVGLARRTAPDGPGEAVEVAARAGCLAGVTLLLLSPHYPWYFPFLGVFAAIAPAWCVLWLSVAPMALYLDPWHEFFVWPSIVYAPALLLACFDLRRGILPFGTALVPSGRSP